MSHSKTAASGTPRRVVVKFGTAMLTLANARLNEDLIQQWAGSLASLRQQGVEILLVSSGAVGGGVGELNLPSRPKSLSDVQAVAAVGQGRLMHVYAEAFRRHGLHVAQVLLTRDDMDDRRRNLNIRTCLQRLLAMGLIPIINENDTVAVEELCFGDNDILAAMIASKMGADLLCLFTDVDGLHRANPSASGSSDVIRVIVGITPEIHAMASRAGSRLGKGGMRAKIVAAEAAVTAGIPVVIASGRDPGNLRRILDGEEIGTRFQPLAGARLSARESWLALEANSRSRRLVVDSGARRALVENKKSLLPAGVLSSIGKFERGDVVEICDEEGHCIAKGLTNYSSDEVALIRGHKSSEIEGLLGERRYDEVVHRDNMVALAVR